ncbi:MAG TPA: hypothetical protein VHO28_16325 [Ignavibacteriales bacterium]|nr:hypothetical protein [Ignavibacteriales bacterium]
MDRMLVFFMASLFTVLIALIFMGLAYLILAKWKKINMFTARVQKHGVYFIIGKKNKIDPNLVNQKITENEYNLTKAEEDKFIDGILAAKDQLNAKAAGN